ncbi:hypothetical protein WV31_10105 [Magnetospirillum sp. ME-1]|uniref:hypothetical protein n=1 Tax=Magnetospirillum sp. ME-1 TaxID=1639348 RepID=UPI000A17C2BD|nr:hypothetical protein [Magnetospirillum sp. ME-1]ARJ65980.1 hypothetical protein WV31_10105 [Magnetospirillum sp. ME-1]
MDMSSFVRLARKPKRRYAIRFPDGSLRELHRTRGGEWEVERPDAGPGIVVSYGALWRAKHAARSQGLGFVVLK